MSIIKIYPQYLVEFSRMDLDPVDLKNETRLKNLIRPSKITSWIFMIATTAYITLLSTSLIIAQWTPNFETLDGFSILDNWISDLGGIFFTPYPFLFNSACIIGGISSIPMTLSFSFALNNKIFAYLGGLIGIFGNLAYIGVGIFSIDNNMFGIMHGISAGVAFFSFALCAFFFGLCIMLYEDHDIPKSFGLYGIIGPLTSIILFILFKNPIFEWICLFSILGFMIPMSIFIFKR